MLNEHYAVGMTFTIVSTAYIFIGVKAMCNCLECNEEFDSKSKLSRHIFLIHKLTSKEYYDKFFKQPGEGFCLYCGKPTEFKNLKRGYKKSCCKKHERLCAGLTIEKKFGNKSFYKTDYFKGKRTESLKERYGVEHPLQNEESKEKQIKHRKQTCKLKYNVEHNWASKELRELGQYKTCLEKLGVKIPAQNKMVLDKMKATTNERFGKEYYTQTDEYKNRIHDFWKNLNEEELVSIVKSRKHKYKAPNGKTYDSNWEYKFELYLDEHKINYEYQSSTIFKWIDYNGKERTYIPDFKLITENGEQFIEIKGDHFFDKDGKFFDPYDKTEEGYKNAELKWKCMVENNVKIYTSKELISLGIDLL